MMKDRRSGIARWIARFLAEDPPRSKSLVVTLFGDALAPRGGAIWLGGLIGLLEPFGVNERLTRTSVFRLAEEGWFESRREGRRSLYALTPAGQRRIEHAGRRIYRQPAASWDGAWTLVLLPRSAGAGEERAELRKELKWEGFGLIAPGLYARPATDADLLDDLLQTLNLGDTVFAMQARQLPGVGRPMRELVDEGWDLGELATGYRAFIARFQPLRTLLRNTASVDPHEAFMVRVLLIHAWRRTVLHDPQMPAELLPADWPGHRAHELCRELYALAFDPAESHLSQAVEGAQGRLPDPAAFVHERFGGLDAVAGAAAA